ncbi:DNL zinc finger domain-containing protein [Trichophyton rubrum]|uniref:DNL zinc finger domain-containing protein n=1 Tax=Trichophyton rubrum TaxID=5551 RepID=A0A178EPG1_TRIRU|nr:DNL zinc finger domain-containing protein [Trichophyton rubrum]
MTTSKGRKRSRRRTGGYTEKGEILSPWPLDRDYFDTRLRQRADFPSRNSYSTTTRDPHPLTDNKTSATTEEEAQAAQARRDQEPAYLIYFTCKPCSHSNRHVISDHLKIFSDAPVTLEDLLAQKGLKITKGTMEGDMEWWAKDEENAEASPETISSEQAQLKGGEGQDGKA